MLPGIELIPALPEQEPILANLLELYGHDFSEFHDIDLGADGRYGYKHLPLYWSEPDRHPFLVRIDGKLAGLVLVKGGPHWDMAEFFVVRKYRRRGVGTELAHAVWRLFPGPWEVRVMDSNQSAYRFWERAISTFTAETIRSVQVEVGGKCWRRFSFEARL